MRAVSLPEYGHLSVVKSEKIIRSISLPVAPQTVARTRFSPPPNVKDRSLQIPDVLNILDELQAKQTIDISTVVIKGPGDPLATPELLFETLQAIHTKLPDASITLQTLGMGSDRLASRLKRSGVSKVEMKVEGVRRDILEKIYSWIRPGSKTLMLRDAVDFLIKEQRMGVSALNFHDIQVSIITTLFPDHNIHHIQKICSEMQEHGAKSIWLAPFIAHPEAEVNLPPPDKEAVLEAQKQAARYLPVLPSSTEADYQPKMIHRDSTTIGTVKPDKSKPNIAIASSNGIDIDLHLGHATKFLIYGPRQDGLHCLLEIREAPRSGSKDRWQNVCNILQDCSYLLVSRAGQEPQKALAEYGLKLLITEENIEGMVDAFYGGKKKK